jgi:hypothetical protein
MVNLHYFIPTYILTSTMTKNLYELATDQQVNTNTFNKNYLCGTIVLTICIQNLETHVE